MAYARRNAKSEPPYADVAALATAAQAHWRAGRDLRAKHEHLRMVIEKRYAIPVPEGYEGRSFPTYVGKAAEKLNRAVTALTDKDALQVTVAKSGVGDAAEKRREVVQNSLFGLLEWTDEQYLGTYYSHNAYDCLLASYWVNKVLPAEDALGEAPRPDDDEIAAVEDDPDAAARVAEKYRGKWQQHLRTNPPISIEKVAALSVQFEWDHFDRPIAAYEYRQMGVRTVLTTWQKDGKPCAWDLYRSVCAGNKLPDPDGKADAEWERGIEPEITDEHLVSVVFFADREWYQVAILSDGLFSEDAPDWRESVSRATSTDAIIHSSRHGMGLCPYVMGTGRTTTSRVPVYRWDGFLDPVAWQPAADREGVPSGLSLCEALDHVVTQRNSTVRQISYSSPLVESAPSPQGLLPGTKDRQEPIPLQEGKLNFLDPGQRIVAPTLISASDASMAERTVSELKAEIDVKTLPAVSFGGTSGESGYDTAQMLGSAGETLEPFRLGLGTGYANVCQVIMAAARVVNERTGEPIPVRYVDEDGIHWLTLTEELLEDQYIIECEVTPQPIGGQLAWIETVEKMYQYGAVSHEEKLILMRNRNPSRTKQQRLTESLEGGDEARQMLGQYFLQLTAGSLLNPQVPGLPSNPQIPSALAAAGQQLGIPEAGELGDLGPTAMAPGTEGLPNMSAFSGAPMNPPPAPNGRGGGVPGSRFGQAQSLPGGLERMAQTTSMNGV